MSELSILGEFEQLVLLAVLRLQGNAYGVTIRREIERQTSRELSRGAVYITLERLEEKGYLASRFADPTPERGGRAKRYYKVKPVGVAALKNSGRALSRLWDGLEPILGKL